MQISKETFIQFLKDNNFYDAWIEGYNLDNEIYDDNIPLEEFFRTIDSLTWLYSGPAAMAMLMFRPEDKEDDKEGVVNRYFKWRDKHLSDYMRLDEKWMDFVLKASSNEAN